MRLPIYGVCLATDSVAKLLTWNLNGLDDTMLDERTEVEGAPGMTGAIRVLTAHFDSGPTEG